MMDIRAISELSLLTIFLYWIALGIYFIFLQMYIQCSVLQEILLYQWLLFIISNNKAQFAGRLEHFFFLPAVIQVHAFCRCPSRQRPHFGYSVHYYSVLEMSSFSEGTISYFCYYFSFYIWLTPCHCYRRKHQCPTLDKPMAWWESNAETNNFFLVQWSPRTQCILVVCVFQQMIYVI